jgi:hypothetical protein
MNQNLVDIWQSLRGQSLPSASRRVSSAFYIYVGLDAEMRSVFYTLSAEANEPSNLQSLKTIDIKKMQLDDKKWLLTLTLLDGDFEKEFSFLCQALLAASSQAQEEKVALNEIASAYEDWLAFFRRSSKFSMEQARGLFGELTFISEFYEQSGSWSEVLLNWLGPFGANQDFVANDFGAYEIKTVQPGAVEVTIASEHQLDYFGKELKLIVYRLKESAHSTLGKSLTSFVGELEENMDGKEVALLRRALAAYGYSADDVICNSELFEVGERKRYDAKNQSFPAVRASELNPSVRKVQYKISLSGLDEFDLDSDVLI